MIVFSVLSVMRTSSWHKTCRFRHSVRAFCTELSGVLSTPLGQGGTPRHEAEFGSSLGAASQEKPLTSQSTCLFNRFASLFGEVTIGRLTEQNPPEVKLASESPGASIEIALAFALGGRYDACRIGSSRLRETLSAGHANPITLGASDSCTIGDG